MSILHISSRPFKSFSRNWADDDEDDFDFDTWVATGDRTSAPSMESLPPLQLQDSSSSKEQEEEEQLAIFGPKSTTQVAHWAQHPPEMPFQHHHAVDMDEVSGAKTVAQRLISDRPAKPAFWESSHWQNGVLSLDERAEYACNWKKMQGGVGCGL